jgi:hypothetical protein
MVMFPNYNSLMLGKKDWLKSNVIYNDFLSNIKMKLKIKFKISLTISVGLYPLLKCQ